MSNKCLHFNVNDNVNDIVTHFQYAFLDKMWYKVRDIRKISFHAWRKLDHQIAVLIKSDFRKFPGNFFKIPPTHKNN